MWIKYYRNASYYQIGEGYIRWNKLGSPIIYDYDDIEYYHINCNCRHMKTIQERRQNSFDSIYVKQLKDEIGIQFQIRRKNLPDEWDDIQIRTVRSWKKISKKRKQWM